MRTFASIVTVIMLLGLAPSAYAQSPTPAPSGTPGPTETLPPLQPTATSLYLYLRPTPTPLTIVINDIGFNVSGSNSAEVADNAINSYRALNTTHILDYFAFGLVLIATIGFMIQFAGRTTRHK